MVYDIIMLIYSIWMYSLLHKLNIIPDTKSKAMIWFSLFYPALIVFWIVYLIIDIHRWPTRIWI